MATGNPGYGRVSTTTSPNYKKAAKVRKRKKKG